ncbi:MAG TPA: hypothetical protein VK588_11430 [Chitinophagaceae bacterium]|nr:hypothetical protein [Chitinophagaceae bacterium]
MSEENFDPRQSLLLIESMINRSRDKFAEDGFMYLLWGWVVFICSLSQFILLHFYKSPYHYVVWLVSWVVVVYQVIYLRKKNRNEKVRTYTSYILGYVWLTFVIVIFLLTFIIGQLTTSEYYTHINPILLTIYGMPIFLSGIILRFKPLILGGIGCWILSVGSMLITNYDYQFLLIPLAMIIAWIIPGYMLRARYKLQSL